MPEENINNTDSLNPIQNQTNVPPSIQAPSEKQPPGNSNQPKFKILAIISIVITICLIVIGGIILYLSQQKPPESPEIAISTTDNITKTPTKESEDNLEPPELYPEFEWEEILSTIPDIGPLLYDDESEELDLNISGKEWHYESLNINNSDERNVLVSGFDSYYEQEAARLGWNNIVEYNDVDIQVLAADGPKGGIMGYAKIEGDKIRLIVRSDNTKYKRDGVNQLPISCPCDIEFNVFVSEAISLGELIKRVGE